MGAAESRKTGADDESTIVPGDDSDAQAEAEAARRKTAEIQQTVTGTDPAQQLTKEQDQHVRTTRDRPESSGTNGQQARNVQHRGDLHGDVASARASEALTAREAAVQLAESNLFRSQNTRKLQDEDLAKRLQQLELREQKMSQLEADAAEGRRIRDAVEDMITTRDERLAEITAVRDAYNARYDEYVAHRDRLMVDRQDVVVRLEQAQHELHDLDEQLAQLDAQDSEDRRAVEEEIARINNLIMTLLSR